MIRNGRVLDGMGNPWMLADVAIRDGRFVRIGKVEGRGRRRSTPRGRYVSPGWIDMMDQSGGVLPRNGLAENKLRMGVTTAIGGEGGTPVPADRGRRVLRQAREERHQHQLRHLLQRDAGADGGDRQHVARADAEELREDASACMDTAMRAGAMGMTTALIYPPGSFATTDELVEMAKVAAKHGGIYATHMRDEGKDLIAAIEEAIAIGERAGLPVEIFHLKAAWQARAGAR